MGHSHEGAAYAGGVVVDQVVPLLIVDGELDGFPDPGVVERSFLDVHHQAPVSRRGHCFRPEIPVGILFEFKSLGRG